MLVTLFDVLKCEWVVLQRLTQVRELDPELLILDDLVKGYSLLLIRVQIIFLIM